MLTPSTHAVGSLDGSQGKGAMSSAIRSQSLSALSQISAAPGLTAATASSQSPPDVAVLTPDGAQRHSCIPVTVASKNPATSLPDTVRPNSRTSSMIPSNRRSNLENDACRPIARSPVLVGSCAASATDWRMAPLT